MPNTETTNTLAFLTKEEARMIDNRTKLFYALDLYLDFIGKTPDRPGDDRPEAQRAWDWHEEEYLGFKLRVAANFYADSVKAYEKAAN